MIKADFFSKGKKILVVGAGRSGLAALRLLAAQGCDLALSDGGPLARLSQDDQQWLEAQQVQLEFGGHDRKSFLGAHCIVVSPGVPLGLAPLAAAREKGIPVIGELELGSLFTDVEIIAITGTNGKTTVTTLIGDLLKAAGREVFVGGNIGTPLSAFVVSGQKADVLVLEVSSFQLDSAPSFRPHIALLLNISPDHLDRYGSYGEYAAAKMQIFRCQGPDDFAVVKADDPQIAARLTPIASQVMGFGRAIGSLARLDKGRAMIALPQQGEEIYPLPKALKNYPQSDNCLAAILAVRLLGCSPQAVARGLDSFRPLEHRLTPVATIKGVAYVDDSKATNIGALQSALAGMTQPVHLLAGGRDKGGDYGLIAGDIKAKVKSLILMGEAADVMAAAYGDFVEIKRARTMAEAVAMAAQAAQPGEVVLLSPACASFDMFSSYEERGKAFQQAVAMVARDAAGSGQGRQETRVQTSCG
ncbi:MAG: UDP-N-acetylmuramoyl-L-alanine--D-glutamate ligase [Desulfurivibrionaceae bacterium]|nr:UDP-N-acetylmuramoyl-L-alanine--D-glutamate ligase [Desulfurivibrionaceae bacterium]